MIFTGNCFSFVIIVLVAVVPVAIYCDDIACLLPSDAGDMKCSAWSNRWHFDKAQNRCVEFRYAGCGGNANNFLSARECVTACASKSQKWYADIAGQKGLCFLPKKVGPCSYFIERYFFNVDTRLCEKFQYSGCAGNANNFATLASCRSMCEDPAVAPTTPITMMPWWKDVRCSGLYLKDARAKFPYMKCESNPAVKFQYNRETNRCEQVDFYGCPRVKNMNLFEMMNECQKLCEPTK